MDRREFLRVAAIGGVALCSPLAVAARTVEVKEWDGVRQITLRPFVDLRVRPKDSNPHPNAYVDLDQEVIVLDEKTVHSLRTAYAVNPHLSREEVVDRYETLLGLTLGR